MQAIFDVDEYQKGGSVLRMLWDYMSSTAYGSARLPDPGSFGHDANVRVLLPSRSTYVPASEASSSTAASS